MCLGVPGKIVEMYDNNGIKMAKIDFGGVFREACIHTLPDAKINDYTIIHAGFAISLMSESEARETLDALEELALIDDEFEDKG